MSQGLPRTAKVQVLLFGTVNKRYIRYALLLSCAKIAVFSARGDTVDMRYSEYVLLFSGATVFMT